MSKFYSQSAVLIYESKCSTTLIGTVISFYELSNKPLLFSIITGNRFSIHMLNPYHSFESFLAEILSHIANIDNPVFLFSYDRNCFIKYKETYKIDFEEFFLNFKVISIQEGKFNDIEDFYSYSLPENYYSFFNVKMYKDFIRTKDLTEILFFVKSIIFSKLILVIDSNSNYKLLSNEKEVVNELAGFLKPQ